MILLVESCLRQHHDATVQHVHRCMAEYLKLAPYRAGGAGRGCHTANFLSTLEGAVADNSRVTDTVDDGDEADDDGDGEFDGGDEADDDGGEFDGGDEADDDDDGEFDGGDEADDDGDGEFDGGDDVDDESKGDDDDDEGDTGDIEDRYIEDD